MITQPSAKEYLVTKAVSVIPAKPEKDAVGVAELRRQLQDQAAKEKADIILADFGSYLKMKVYENRAQTAFSYLTKAIQENRDDED